MTNKLYFCGRNTDEKKRVAMETITLRYDATNPALRALMAAFLKLDGVTKVKVTKSVEPEYDPEVVAKVKRGREAFRKGECVTVKAEDVWN